MPYCDIGCVSGESTLSVQMEIIPPFRGRMHMDVPVERRAAVTFLSGGVQRFVVEAVLHAHPTFISRDCQ